MSEHATQWGEADAISTWLKRVGVMVKPEEAYELAAAVTKFRLDVMEAHADKVNTLRARVLAAAAEKERYSESGDGRYTEACVRLRAYEDAYKIMGGIL